MKKKREEQRDLRQARGIKKRVKKNKEKYLLLPERALHIETKTEKRLDFPPYYNPGGIFQVSGKLYMCGGQIKQDDEGALTNLLLFITHQGFGSLSSMYCQRDYLSLSGTKDMLVAVGGKKEEWLRLAQAYSITRNKWTVLPQLSTLHQTRGSCALNGNTFFTFSGNTLEIEVFYLEHSLAWKSVRLVLQSVGLLCRANAISYKGEILVVYQSRREEDFFEMRKYSEEGELMGSEADVPQDLLNSDWNVSFAQDGAVYITGTLYLYEGPQIGGLVYSNGEWDELFQ